MKKNNLKMRCERINNRFPEERRQCSGTTTTFSAILRIEQSDDSEYRWERKEGRVVTEAKGLAGRGRPGRGETGEQKLRARTKETDGNQEKWQGRKETVESYTLYSTNGKVRRRCGRVRFSNSSRVCLFRPLLLLLYGAVVITWSPHPDIPAIPGKLSSF